MATPSPTEVAKLVEETKQVMATPKPKPKPTEPKVHVTNPGFRDSEALRELQRQLHREANKRGRS